MDFRDITRVAGILSVGATVASGIVAASAKVSVIANAAGAASGWNTLANALSPLAAGLMKVPFITEGAHLLGGAFASHFLLGVAAVAGLCVAVPWALDVIGKALDGATTKVSSKVERMRANAEDEKIRLQYRQQQPAIAPAPAYPHPADLAAGRGVSYAANYQQQQDQIQPGYLGR